ncbi:MAG: hypothetical protein EBU49_01325, partial [Proteobacteria bacterium]|nr:hypothetical protein [Pseudomonadota bacterium]
MDYLRELRNINALRLAIFVVVKRSLRTSGRQWFECLRFVAFRFLPLGRLLGMLPLALLPALLPALL